MQRTPHTAGYAQQSYADYRGRRPHRVPNHFTRSLDFQQHQENLRVPPWVNIQSLMVSAGEHGKIPRPIDNINDLPHYCLQTYDEKTGQRYNFWLRFSELDLSSNTFEPSVRSRQLGEWLTDVLAAMKEDGYELKLVSPHPDFYSPRLEMGENGEPEVKKPTEAELYERMIDFTASQMLQAMASQQALQPLYTPNASDMLTVNVVEGADYERRYALQLVLPCGLTFRSSQRVNGGAYMVGMWGGGGITGDVEFFGQQHHFSINSEVMGDQLQYLVSTDLLGRLINERFEFTMPFIFKQHGALNLNFDKRAAGEQ